MIEAPFDLVHRVVQIEVDTALCEQRCRDEEDGDEVLFHEGKTLPSLVEPRFSKGRAKT